MISGNMDEGREEGFLGTLNGGREEVFLGTLEEGRSYSLGLGNSDYGNEPYTGFPIERGVTSNHQ